MSLISSFGLSTKPSLAQFHALLKCYTESKNPKRVFLVFRELLVYDEKPNDHTFALLMKGCATPSTLRSSRLNTFEANLIHTQLMKSGCCQFVHLSTALLGFYVELGYLKLAQQVFDDMPDRDLVACNALICGFSRNGCHFDALYLFVRMLREGFTPCHSTLAGLAPSCGKLGSDFNARTVHGFGIKTGLGLDSQVKNALTSMYSKCDNMESVELLFEEMEDKSVVSWNTMISAFGQNGFSEEAVTIFKRMRERRIEANAVTIVCLLSANSDPAYVHCYSIKTGLVEDFSVKISFVCGYAKLRDSKSAEEIYMSCHEESLVGLTAIISCYAEKGEMKSVVKHFSEMQRLDMKPDAVTMIGIFHRISEPAQTEIGMAFHCYGVKLGLSTDNLFANGLLNMYSKLDQTEATFSIFHEMTEKPLITWNSMISGCVQSGRSVFAFDLFFEMKTLGYKPDAVTMTSLLSGCGQLGCSRIGETIHSYILRNEVEIETFVETALIDMYVKCGRLERAERVFDSVRDPCLATWNSMISGYSLYGKESEALSSFSEMRKRHRSIPDRITFVGLLTACSYGCLVSQGREFFEAMSNEFKIEPELEHFACMVGLLGRAGLFSEALVLIGDMKSKPDSGIWGSLLGACCVHQEVKLGEYLAKKMFLLDATSGGFYVLMSNLYALNGRWDDVAKMREMMRENAAADSGGFSVVQVTSLRDFQL